MLLFTWAPTSQAQSVTRQPILIDTDIGTGINDAFALLLAFGSHELDVRGITTVGDPANKKVMMLCRFLTATGRRHTRVAAGVGKQPKRPLTDQYKYYYHPDALFNRTTKPEKLSAPEFLYRRLKQQPGKVTIVALGPLTNIAQLIETHPDAVKLIPNLWLLESNIAHDTEATRKVFASKIPCVVLPARVCEKLTLDDNRVKMVFRPGTALTRQVQTMYQMWDKKNPNLDEALAVALCMRPALAKFAAREISVDEKGQLHAIPYKTANDTLVTSVSAERFPEFYARRIASLQSPSDRPSKLVPLGKMPNRVHVAENYDTEIERYWWMSGKPETKLLPSGSLRACRGVLTHDFDDLLMASRNMYSAVIFNPVPGPPMGKNTRLTFRYWLKGTDTIRVQIYSLTNGYHRQLVVNNLPQGKWQQATVDMTEARRPDGTGGPLDEGERIDDIQFYIDPDGEILIDDVLLYDAADKEEKRPFPKKVIYTAGFDTGKREKHWLGEFTIVPEKGHFWRAISPVINKKTGQEWIRLKLKGQRRLGAVTHLSVRHHLKNADKIEAKLVNTQSGHTRTTVLEKLPTDRWAQSTWEFSTGDMNSADEIHLLLPMGAELLADDVLLYEPSE